MLRVDSPHQLAFIEPEADRVVGLARPRLPRRLLTGKDDREPIQVGDNAGIDGSLNAKSPAWWASSWRTVILSLPCCANSGQ